MASGVSLGLFRFQRALQLFSLKGSRTYLSEAYKCQEAWDNRLAAPLIKNINLDDMYYEIDQKFQQGKGITAVDVDLFATAVQGDAHLDELEDLVHRLRLSANAGRILPSTSHSLVRAFFAAGHSDSLLRILNDRLNYGVFLDHFTANLLLDSFLKNKQYLEAAKVGVLQMLQEDWEHPLVTRLSLLGCVHHLNETKPWDSVGVSPQIIEETQEEIKIRVKYLRNPFFDDHFDLQDGTLLVGKTMALLGPHVPNKSLAQSMELLGCVLYGKFGKASELINTCSKQNNVPFLTQAVTMALESLKTKESSAEIVEEQANLQALLSSVPTCNEELIPSLENTVLTAVAEYESKDIENQKTLYKEWEKRREQELIEQLTELDKITRLASIEEKKKYLEEKEERLYFFDKEHEWELKIEENQPKRIKRWFGKKKKKRVLDEGYIPPEIGRSTYQ